MTGIFEKEILEMSEELSVIVNKTSENLAGCHFRVNNTNAVQTDFNLNQETITCSNSTDIVLIEEHLQNELEYHDIEHVLIDENSQTDSQSGADPLSDGFEMKPTLHPIVRLVPVKVKNEQLMEDCKGDTISQVLSSNERTHGEHNTFKCRSKKHRNSIRKYIFQCDRCPYRAYNAQIIGQHKRRVHNIIGVRNKKLKTIRKPSSDISGLQVEKIADDLNKQTSELELFNCNVGSYVAVSNNDLSSHNLSEQKNIEDQGSSNSESTNVQTPFNHTKPLGYSEKLPESISKPSTDVPVRHLRVVNTRSKPSELGPYHCNFCSYIAVSSNDLTSHKLSEHKNVEHQGSSNNELSSLQENKATIENTISDNPKSAIYKCDLCAFTSYFKRSMRIHTYRKHLVIRKETKDCDSAKQSVMKLQKRDLNAIKMKYKKYNFPTHVQFASSSTDLENVVLSCQSSSKQRDVEQVENNDNTDEAHVTVESQCHILKYEEENITDDITQNANLEVSSQDWTPDPLIVHTESLDEAAWTDIEEQSATTKEVPEKETCPKCSLHYDPNAHSCHFKCELCSFTSKYRKVIVRHEYFVHTKKQKKDKKKITGKYYKCDMCSYRHKHIQSIGSHRRSVHNVDEKVSENMLKNKRCIIGSKAEKPYTCKYCSYKSKYVQNIGVHMKRDHGMTYRANETSQKISLVKDKKVADKKECQTIGSSKTGNMSSIVDTTANLKGEETCPKCKMCCDPTDHICVFKCNLCSFTSRKRQTLLKHNLREHIKIKLFRCDHCPFVSRSKSYMQRHKLLKHPSGVRLIQRVSYKCDLCSYTSSHIQAIGRHKKKVHNIEGRTSEQFLKAKKCIKNISKLFKCEYCSFKAKHIQSIGSHKKKFHEELEKSRVETTYSPKGLINGGIQNTVQCATPVSGEKATLRDKSNNKGALKFKKRGSVNLKTKKKTDTGNSKSVGDDMDESNQSRKHLDSTENSVKGKSATLTTKKKKSNPNALKYNCPKCNKGYKFWRNVLRHIQRDCTKPHLFKCFFCNYSSVRKDHLIRHVFARHKEHYQSFIEHFGKKKLLCTSKTSDP